MLCYLQDIIPQYGLSFHKPSTLWPPPPDDLTTEVHQGLRSRIRDAIRPKSKDERQAAQNGAPSTTTHPEPPAAHHEGTNNSSRVPTPDYTLPLPEHNSGRTLHLGSVGTLPLPIDGVRSQRVTCTTKAGETLTLDEQVHMYAPNYLLAHPLVSPVVSYLGGLPPMLVIASDKEVLRDEIIYL